MSEKTEEDKTQTIHAGIDEMNLAELPIASLGRSNRSTNKVLTCEVMVKVDGEYRLAKWLVSGSASEGLPTDFAERVLVVLMAITHQQGYADPDRKVNFSCHQILKILDLSIGSYNYDRVKGALSQLSGLTIRSDLAFLNATTGQRIKSNKWFHLIDNFEVLEKDDVETETFIRWNKVFWQNFQADGGVKYLDLDFYLSLENAIARRLYRILSKRFYVATNTDEVYHEEDVFQFANRVGLSGKYPKPTKIRQVLRPGVTELIERGFLLSEEPIKYRTGGKTYTRLRFTKHPGYLTNLEKARQLVEAPILGEDEVDPEARREAEAASELARFAQYGTTQTEVDLWKEVQASIRRQMTQATYDEVLARSMLLARTDHTATIGLHSEQAQQWAENRLEPVIRRALESYVDNGSLELTFVTI